MFKIFVGHFSVQKYLPKIEKQKIIPQNSKMNPQLIFNGGILSHLSIKHRFGHILKLSFSSSFHFLYTYFCFNFIILLFCTDITYIHTPTLYLFLLKHTKHVTLFNACAFFMIGRTKKAKSKMKYTYMTSATVQHQ